VKLIIVTPLFEGKMRKCTARLKELYGDDFIWAVCKEGEVLVFDCELPALLDSTLLCEALRST
jgi:hypothetical protein